MMQIRSKLEQSAVLWHFGLSQKNRNDLERVQMTDDRGKSLYLNFDKLKKLFPKSSSSHDKSKRKFEL